MGIGSDCADCYRRNLCRPVVSRDRPGLISIQSELARSVFLTRLMLPAQIFFYEGSILAPSNTPRASSLIPSLAPLIYNSSVIVAGVLLFSKIGITGFSFGVVLGAILWQFSFASLWSAASGSQFHAESSRDHPGFVLFLKLSVPIMLALGLTFADDWITRHYASYLGDAVTLLQYAKNLMQVPLGIVGQAIGVASFPILAQLYSEKKLGDLNRVLNSAVKALVICLVPISTLMMAESQPLVHLFYTQRA